MSESAVASMSEVDPDGLGPSFTPEFTNALPLDELVADKDKRPTAARVQPAPVPTPKLDEAVLMNTMQQIDIATSALLDVEEEGLDTLDPIVKNIYPLAEYYASQQASVTTLAIIATLAMLSYATIKMNRVRRRDDDTHVEEE